jgi:hypothetical protein
MADRIIKFKRGATAAAQKAQQKKGGEDQTPSFGQDVSAALALDLEKWEKEEREAQKAGEEEDEEEFDPPIIPRGVPSTSRPPATATSTTPNEKRQKVEETKMGSLNFQQLFADTTGHQLNDLIDRGLQVSTNQSEKVQKETINEGEPPRFVRGSIKAKRLWIAGFGFDRIDLTEAFPQGKDIAVLAVNEAFEDKYLTADDGIALYTKGFIKHYGVAALVEQGGGQLLATTRGSTEFVRLTR